MKRAFNFKFFCYLLLAFLVFFIIIYSLSRCSKSEFVPKSSYSYSTEKIDVIIPCASKDLDTLNLCIDSIRKNGENIRNIYVISDRKLTDKARWIDESIYPFSKQDVVNQLFNSEDAYIKYQNSGPNRIGWIYQQLLKLYAIDVVPGISSNVLCLDSDTMFLKKTRFMDERGFPFFDVGEEYHKPYFSHAKRLLPHLKRVHTGLSGISHHMLFQRSILADIKDLVEKRHSLPFWKAFLVCIDPKELHGSFASEYEIYFNFTLIHTDRYHIRKLKWKNIPFMHEIESFQSQGYDFVSCHSWLREQANNQKLTNKDI